MSVQPQSKGEPSVKIRPLHDRVIVRRLEEERKSPGGIVIPDTAKEKPIEAEVVAVGSGKLLDELSALLKVKPQETTPDGTFTMETVACFGSCALAPVMVVDGKVYVMVPVTGA